MTHNGTNPDEWFEDKCDKCGTELDGDCIEYGNGESGYICTDCYSSLADNYQNNEFKEVKR